MSSTNGVNKQTGKVRVDADEMKRLMEARDWDALDQLAGFSPEEAERILREEPMIDAAEVNRMLGITDAEITEVLKSRPAELQAAPKKGP